jgi:tripartite-type tricarboxylate transporter receptor subunit TctC
MTNEVQLIFINLASSLANIRAGRMKALATTWPTRRPELPNVPTIAEAGFPGYGTNAWNGLFAPAGIPKPLLRKIHDDVLKVMDMPATKEALAKVYMTPVVNSTPEEFQKFVLEEIKAWSKVAVENNIKVE